MLELLLPRTDAGVYVQWAVMVPLWLTLLITTRQWSKDARLFMWGLATVNVAWFMIRMAH